MGMSFRRKFLTATLVAMTMWHAQPASAQSPWLRTPYQSWSRKDAEKVLNDSPWVRIGSRGTANTRLPTGTYYLGDVTVRLLSAAPVRQAIARLRRLSPARDRMGAAERAAFDAATAAVLDCPRCKDYYIVTLEPSNPRLAARPLGTLQKYITLADERGAARELAQAELPRAPGGQVILYFRRRGAGGEPLFTAASKRVVFSIDAGVYGSNSGYATRFEFDVSKMILNGEVAF